MIKGTAYVLKRPEAISGGRNGGEDELSRFHSAFDAVHADIAMSADDDEILAAHLEMMEDPMLSEAVEAAIADGLQAEDAVRRACSEICAMFADIDDEYLKARVDDVRDICNQMERALLGTLSINPFARLPENSVIVAEELFPSDTAMMDFSKIAGFITAKGSTTSHVCIIARSKGIPAIVGYDISGIKTGDKIEIDEDDWLLSVTPAGPCRPGGQLPFCSGRKHFVCLLQAPSRPRQRKRGDRLRWGPKDGRQGSPGLGTIGEDDSLEACPVVPVYCNAASVEDVKTAIEAGAEGIGLFRTEFLFMQATGLPSEDEQYETYRAALVACGGRPLTIRTLDIGGDKSLPYLPMQKEDNPFLGLRGIRFCLAHPEILRTQLRALVRAAAEVPESELRIMIPMVDLPEEVLEVSAMLDDEKSSLGLENVPVGLGIMVETPAALFNARELASCSDFFSLGTNDLTQYVMAADRGNSKVAYLYDTVCPAMRRAIEMAVSAAHEAGISVGVCGEAASDPAAAAVLAELGVDYLSVSRI